MSEEFYLVGKGRISGTYADGFHRIDASGLPRSLVGHAIDGHAITREFYEGEREQILSDIRRHREVLIRELKDLEEAEKAILSLSERV